MNKTIMPLISTCLILSLSLGLVACNQAATTSNVVTNESTDSNSTPTPAPKPLSAQFVIISSGFTLINTPSSDTAIPYGSIIFHWSNGITEVDRPDGTLLILAKDSEAGTPPNPSGWLIPATWFVQYPNGTQIVPEKDASGDNNLAVVRYYLEGQLILTVVTLSEPY